ncbi:MAG: nitronate monooxygenase [Acholeplasmataceae bacterium]|nr:nitronate monooxygenase [Acholeplasmataceae bacterium]
MSSSSSRHNLMMTDKTNLPKIIQGGMGVGISSWQLARTVSMHGQLGVVSGTAVAHTLARRLQDGDMDGYLNAAISQFPFPEITKRVVDRYLRIPEASIGKDKYKAVPMPTIDLGRDLMDLMVVANFVEVYLAKSGHQGVVGINLLEKIQVPTLASLYGALLADVDYVLMGAGIPVHIPAVLDSLSQNLDTKLPVKIAEDESKEPTFAYFSPSEFAEGMALPKLNRPKFLAIVSSSTLATRLSRSITGSPDGFVVEAPIAGGHNASPRGKMELDEMGEPIYGPRDEIDIPVIAALGMPFWLAGGYGTHEQLRYALSVGASGIQVGTAFAFCEESGMKTPLKHQILDEIKQGKGYVRTDPRSSPTGFPFKVVEASGTNGVPETGVKRQRICDLGYLREPYRKENGKIGYRCPSEPVDDYVKKGGKLEDTVGRQCLCNGLVSTMGLGQERRNGSIELPIVTAGDDLKYVLRYFPEGKKTYNAVDVLTCLLGKKPIQIT